MNVLRTLKGVKRLFSVLGKSLFIILAKWVTRYRHRNIRGGQNNFFGEEFDVITQILRKKSCSLNGYEENEP